MRMSDELKATADRVVAECWDGDELNMQDLIAAITAALKAEREECAKVAQKWPTYSYCNERIAAAIRGRP